MAKKNTTVKTKTKPNADDSILPEIKYKLVDFVEGDFKAKVVHDDNPFKLWLNAEQIAEQFQHIRAMALEYCRERGVELDPNNVIHPDPKKVKDSGVMDAAELLDSLCYANPAHLNTRAAGVVAAAMRATWLYSQLIVKPKEVVFRKGVKRPLDAKNANLIRSSGLAEERRRLAAIMDEYVSRYSDETKPHTIAGYVIRDKRATCTARHLVECHKEFGQVPIKKK